MIPLLVFYLHVVGMAVAFTKRWQDEGLGEGFLALFFIALIFFVGWSISSFIMKLLMTPQGFGPLFDRDAASLVLLAVMEAVFYTLYLRGADDGKEKGLGPEGSTAGPSASR